MSEKHDACFNIFKASAIISLHRIFKLVEIASARIVCKQVFTHSLTRNFQRYRYAVAFLLLNLNNRRGKQKKKENRYRDSLRWAILGLRFFRAGPQQHVSRRDPSTSLFAVGIAGANGWNEGDNRR